MKVNFSQQVQSLKNGYHKVVDKSKTVYSQQVKPFVKNSIKYTKDLAVDTVDFVKKNPRKAGKYAAIAAAGLAGVTLVVKGIKNAVKAHKQNKILTEAVITQRETINDLKELAAINKDIIEGKDRVIERLKNS